MLSACITKAIHASLPPEGREMKISVEIFR
jgi:hypothetical protein